MILKISTTKKSETSKVMPGPAWGSMRNILKPRFVTRILVSSLWASELLYNVARWLTIRYVKYEEIMKKKLLKSSLSR